MTLSTKSLAGPGFIILNVLRAMNITGLLAVITASIVMLVKTFIVSRFFFFDAANHVIVALICMFLVASEASVFRGYFARNWPLLSPNHGFAALGWTMVFLGVNTLGNMNKEATSQQNLGMAFWRIVIASGIIVVILGSLNIVASYVFRDTTLGITARQVRAKGAIATPPEPYYPSGKTPPSINTSFPSASSYASPTSKRARMSFSPVKTFRAARASILPSYHSNRPPYPDSIKSGDKNAERNIEISSPMNVNPQFAHLVKPNLAHHPSQKVGEGAGAPF